MLKKRTVYLLLAMLLGMLLGDIVFDILEVSYLSASTLYRGNALLIYEASFFALRPLPEILFDLLGIIGGYYVGKNWWNIIYVKDRRKKNYKLDW